MTRSLTPRQTTPDAVKPVAADRIEEPVSDTGRWRWGATLTWFMRLVALLWVVKGLGAWAVILGAWEPTGVFEGHSLGSQTTVVYFAVIDLIAAVGLWMASTWGGVLWLLAVMSHLILMAFFPSFIPGGIFIFGFFVLLILAYLTVSWLSAREASANGRASP